jgi:DNA-binding GntR family transcriptional regulator
LQSKPQTRSDQAYAYLIEELRAGRGRPGETISTYALAEELSMSRSPIIEALKRLESEGLVEIVPQVGCRVVRPSAATLHELHALLAVLDGLAAEHAAKRATARQLRELRALDARMVAAASAADRRRFEDLDEDFHLHVIDAARLPRVGVIAGGVRSQVELHRSRSAGGADELQAALAEHAEILRALEARDARAAREFAQRHVLRNGERLVTAMDVAAADGQASAGRPSSSPARS